MGINASTAGAPRKPYTPIKPGPYPARLVQVIDMGLQNQRAFKGTEKPPAQEIRLTYELLDEFMLDEDGQALLDKPRWVSEDMPLHNLAAEKAKSTGRYKALDPANKYKGNFGELLNTPCVVTIVNNPGKGKNVGKTYENIAGVSPMRDKDAAVAVALKNEPRVFDLDAPDLDTFNKFPKFVQEKIKGNLNFAGSVLAKMLEDMGGSVPTAPTPPKAETEDDDGDSPY